MRYFIELAYNGNNYHGWQTQPNAVTVQQTLNRALTVLLKSEIEVMGAGRTDTGVHARQMYAHFDYENPLDCFNLIYKLNSFLPADIAIDDFFQVSDDAHARFDATSRTYEYHINNSKNVFLTDLSWYYNKQLDLECMNLAANLLIGRQDFQCFSKVNTEVNNYICNVSFAQWKLENDLLIFTITADRFLRNMVRAIVGTLINIGSDKINIDEFKAILESKNRCEAGFSVPAHGLYLTKIKYPYI